MNPVRCTFRILCIAFLAGLLGARGNAFTGGGDSGAQKSAPKPLPDAEAKQLRSEADRAYTIQNHAEALEKYLKVFPNYSEDFEVNERIGWLYFHSSKSQYQKAIPFLLTAHRLDPKSVDVLHDLATAEAWVKQFEESLAHYRELVALAPNIPDYWLEYARALKWAGENSEAINQYLYYLNLSPTDFAGRLELARLLGEQKDFTDAMGQYNYVLRFSPSNVTARLGLAQILAWSGQLRPSLAEVEKILKSQPHNFDARVVKAYDLLWLGQFDEAKPIFLDLAKIDTRDQDVQAGLKEIARHEQAAVAAAGRSPAGPTRPAPLPGPADLELAEKLESQGKFTESIAHYRAYLEEFPHDDAGRLRLARVLGWNKEFAESESILRGYVARNPRDPEGHFQLGRVLSWDQQYDEAIAEFQKGMALRTPDAAAHTDFAGILFAAGKYPEALEQYKTALSLQPDDKEAALGVAQVMIASGQLDLARKQLGDLKQKYPDDAETIALGQKLSVLEAPPKPAQRVLQPATETSLRAEIQRNPGNADAHTKLANLLVNANQFPSAIEEFHAALALKPNDGELKLRLAQVLSWNRQYPESEALYREWLKRHPDDREVRMDLARVLSWGKDYPASTAAYRELLKQPPHDAEVRLELARVLGWAKQYNESIREFDKILHDDPKNFDALVGEARVYSYESNWDKALARYDAALNLKPRDRDARTGEAQVLVWSGKPKQGLAILAELQKEDPKDPTVLISMASAENSLGRPDRALRLLKNAAALEPRNTDIQTLRDAIREPLRPELRVGWTYARDNEGLNIWRYQVMDFRFNLTPRIRSFIDMDFLPSSAPAPSFGYAVIAPGGVGPCPASQTSGCLVFSPRVPLQPYVPSPGLLTAGDFPSELLVAAAARIYQSAGQIQAGATIRANSWFSLTASAGAIQLRHGSINLPQSGFPSTSQHFIYSVAPSFSLGRQWRFTFTTSRQYWAYTPKAISEEIHVDDQSADITWNPDFRSRMALTLYHRTILPPFLIPSIPVLNADGSAIIRTFQSRVFTMHGNGGTLSATRTLWKGEKAQFEAGYDGMTFGYTHPGGLPSPAYYLNAGLFTPSFYQRQAGLIHATITPWNFVTWDLHGTAGVQQIYQGSGFSFSSTAGTRFDLRVSPRATLTLGYDYFNAASALQALVVPTRAAAYHSNQVTGGLDFHF